MLGCWAERGIAAARKKVRIKIENFARIIPPGQPTNEKGDPADRPYDDDLGKGAACCAPTILWCFDLEDAQVGARPVAVNTVCAFCTHAPVVRSVVQRRGHFLRSRAAGDVSDGAE